METLEQLPPFVSASWLEAHLDEVVVADLRWSLDGSEGPATYRERHLPGAVYVDLDTVAAGPPTASEGRHPLPGPEHFAQALGELGIGEDAPVVAYDQGPGAIAARLVWMLRAIGQPAGVLEGGLAGWSGPTETGEATRTAVTRTPVPWPRDRLADADRTAASALRDGAVVLDARDPERYRGESEPVDARPGHIPGAANLPFTDNLEADGRLRSAAELRERYGAVGALDADEVIAYCGSGVTACHDLLVLEQLGRPGRLYPGSWSAWSQDEARAAVRGSAPR